MNFDKLTMRMICTYQMKLNKKKQPCLFTTDTLTMLLFLFYEKYGININDEKERENMSRKKNRPNFKQ